MANTQIRGGPSSLGSQVLSGSIYDLQIAAAAAIATSKLADGAKFIKSDGTVTFAADQPHGGFKITGLADPVNPQDAATRAWVLANVAGGVVSSGTAKAATTGNITLSATQTVDGIALSVGDVVLVKNQTTASANGLYVVASGAWTRHTSMDTWAEVPGMIVSVQEGTVNGDTIWLSTADPGGTLGTTSITFTQIPGPSDIQAGAGLSRVGQALNVVAADNSIIVTGTAPAGGNIKSNSAVVLLKTDYIIRETPTGVVNGSNTTFTLANTPIVGGEQVYLNGILQEPGAGNDYTISGATITYLTAPVTGDRLRVSYVKGAAPTLP
jgi:hypothetical protein